MKKFLSLFASLALTVSISAQSFIHYDPAARYPFLGGQGYARDTYDWYVKNEYPVSTLYQNGVPTGASESGSWSLNLDQCWSLVSTCAPIKVAILDTDPTHAARGLEIIAKVAPGVSVQFFAMPRFYPFVVSAGINAAVAWGADVIALSAGVSGGTQAEMDYLRAQIVSLRNLYWQTAPDEIHSGVVLCVAAANANYCACSTFDSPSTWSETVYNIMPASPGYMNGTRVTNPGAAWGQNFILFPGRNIVAGGYYTSGGSEANWIQTGCVTLMLAQMHEQTGIHLGFHVVDTQVVIQGIRDFAVQIGVRYNPPQADILSPMLNFDPYGLIYRKPPPSGP